MRPFGSGVPARPRRRARTGRPLRSVAAVACVVVLLGGVDGGLASASPPGTHGARHRAAPAPKQRWGSAAGKGHLVGRSGNHTNPVTLRSKYPLAAPPPAPKARPNPARVVAAPPKAVRGFDARTSRPTDVRKGAYDRTYANADGTQTTVFSPSPVNYRRPDGSWAPIDPRLVPVGSGWRNTADTVDTWLAHRADSPELAWLGLDADHSVAFGLDGAAGVAGRAQGDVVTYPSVRPGVDLRLQSQPGGVKETLVLRSPAAPRSFDFPLSLTGLSASVVDGQVVLTDAGGRRRAVFPAGYMTDSASGDAGPAVSPGVTYTLVSSGGRPVLRVSLDSAWLSDPARVFPVLVDPSVASGSASSSMVVHGSSSTSGSSELLVGREGDSPSASYLKFAGLASSLANHTIFAAQLQVVNFDSASCRARSVSVHPVTQSWSGSTGFSYPGPAVGSALTSRSFAYGFIGLGQSSSPCPTSGVLFNLGEAGRKLVQGWVDGGANNGLSLRASATDSLGWKRFAGTGTVNPPKLFVTHSPYNAKYSIPNPVPNPPVLQNQAGQVKVTVTNTSAEAWSTSSYYLAYRAYNASTGASVTQQRAANLPSTVARGSHVTLTATIQPLPPGKYFLDFTMVHTGGPVFTDEQVPPARIVIEVFDIPPVVQGLFPPNGYQAQTLTPVLWAKATDIDAPPNLSLQYKFELCEKDNNGAAVNCTTTPYQTAPSYTVPAGRFVWSRTYLWRAFVKDATNEVASSQAALLTAVPQPAITSHVSGSPQGTSDREFDPQVGNYSTSAVDAPVVTVGPQLTLVRTYNSLDPRRGSAFGAGWSTRYDMKVVPDDDGSGNVVVTYPDGQEVRFGRNPDGTYAAPQGRTASLTFDGTKWTLLDRDATSYQFSGDGRLTRITDSAGRSVVLTYNTADGTLARATVSNSQTNTSGRFLSFTWSGGHVASVSTNPVGGTPLTWTYTYSGDLLTKVCAPDSTCTTYSYAEGSHYRTAVIDDRPDSYWRLGEPDGTDAGSQVAANLGKDAGTYSNVTLGAAGAILGSDDTAGQFNGTSSHLDLPKGTLKRSRDAAVELWFRANPAGTGGPLLGYQDKPLGQTSTVGVPILYQGTDGRLHGQFYTGTIAPITSATLVNDGLWHHAVLSQMDTTVTLYLDGKKVGTATVPAVVDTSLLTDNQVGAAYATNPTSWPGWGSAPQRSYDGTIDEVAVYTHPLGPGQVAAHNALGRASADQLTQVTLPSGRVASAAEYDVATDRVVRYTDENGGTWRVEAPLVYGGDTDLRRGVQVYDPTGRPYLYEYDALSGNLVRSGTPTGLAIRDEDKVSDPSASPSPSPSPSPTETCTSPDPGDPQFCTTIPGSSDGPVFTGHDLDGMAIRTFTYDDNGFQSAVTDENGDTIRFTHDARGNVTSKTTCRTATECHTEYTSFPAVTNPFDPRNDLPTAHRDARSASAADNTYLTTYTYTATGELATQTNPDGGTVTNTYSVGNEIAVGGGAVPAGLLLKSTDPRGAVTTYAYYQNGDLAKVTEPSGLSTSFTYDELGRKTSETEVSDATPAGITTTYTYDAQSRLLTTTEPATTDAVTGERHQGRTTNTYDADGNLTSVSVSDLLGNDATRTTTNEYDDHGRLVKVTDAQGNETSYEYDSMGNRTAMVDANGNRYEYGYTARNQIAEIRLRDWQGDPNGAGDPAPGDYLVLHSYAYDFAGHLVRDVDAMGHELDYAYYHDGLQQSVTAKNVHNPDGSTRDYVVESDTYDGAGNLTRQVRGNGTLVTENTYTPTGQVASTVTDPSGLARRTSFTYDTAGNVLSVTSAGNASNVPWPLPTTSDTVTYSYDLAGRRVSERQTVGATTLTTTHTYDQRGKLTSTTDPRGNVPGADKAAYTTTYSYDEMGRLTTTAGPAVNAESGGGAPALVHPTVTVGYDTFDEAVETRDELGNVSTVHYDTLGRPVTTTQPSYTPPGDTVPVIPTTHTSYDPLGNVTEVVDPLGHATRYTYDRLNRMVTKDEPGSTDDQRAVWHYTYTRTGDVLSVTDPTGAQVQSTYDDLNRRVTMTQVERFPVPDNLTTTYAYDDAGNVTAVTSPSGAVSRVSYDALGQVLTTTDPNNVVSRYGYDYLGRTVRTVDGLGRTSRTDYDGFGRVQAQSDLDPSGTTLRTESYTYDRAGNVLTSTDPLGHVTSYAYDGLNQLVSQTEPVSDTHTITTTFGYDAAGNRTRYTDGRGNSTIFTVNSLGLPESVIEPATAAQPDVADRTWTAVYDADGRTVRMAAPGGVTRTRTFDAAGRLTTETGAGAETSTGTRTLDYDLAGRLTSVNAPGGTDTYTYDDRGDLLTASGPSGAASFAYDADANPVTRTDAAGTSRYTYTNGRLSAVTDAITGTTQSFGYDQAGELSTVDYGAGRVRTYGYDSLDRITSDTLKNAAGQTVASVTYGYDVADRMTSKTTTGTAGASANTYTYDYADRLTSWTSGSTTTTYTWDDSGNRTGAGDTTATYDERNRILTDGDTTYTYTPRGTVSGTASSGLAEPFSFDAFDQLIAQGTTTYSYDGLDRLATRDGTAFAYDGTSDAPVSDGTATYARGPEDELLAVSEGGTQRIPLADAHGDIIGDFDPADTALPSLTDSAAYDPFGQVTATDGTMSNIGYQGEWTDPTTGLVDMGARWYDPGTGAFDSRDSTQYSTGPSILANRYTYAAGDPLDQTDPDGNWPSCGWCHKIAHVVNKYVVQPIYHHVVLPFYHHVILPIYHHVIQPIYHHVIKPIWHAITHPVSTFHRVVNWGRQQAAKARAAAARARRAITARAKSLASWAAKNTPLPVLAAAVKPLLTVGRKLVSAAAHLPAAVVAVTRDVVSDMSKIAVTLYHQATEKLSHAVDDLSKAASVVSEYAKAALPTVAAIAAGAITTLGCEAAAVALTGGAATGACIVAGFAVGGAVAGALNCPPGHSVAGCAGKGLVAGAVGGVVFVATGGTGGGVAAAIVAGGLSSAASSATQQLLDTGTVDLTRTAEEAAVGGATAGLFKGGGRLLARGCNSLATGTEVLLANGDRKPIQDVRIGDRILATNPLTGRTASQPVTDVIVGHGKKRLVAVTVALATAVGGGMAGGTAVANADSGTQAQRTATLVATDGHPFWVDDQGRRIGPNLTVDGRWAEAGDLRPGEWLDTPDGGHVTVVATRTYTETTTVYNLTVDGIHTYYVGAGSTSVLVHNCGETYFRGASGGEEPTFTPRPNEYKVDPNTGYVKPTHGVSVFDNPDSVSSRGYTPHELDPESIPDSLRIIQRGRDPRHFEIVPKPGANLTPEEFTEALCQIRCVPRED
jgi:RHS repeat-associated protein